MYDFSALDSKRLKFLSWVGHHAWVVPLACAGPVALAAYWNVVPAAFVLAALLLWGYVGLLGETWLPGTVFGYANHLDKFFIKHDTDWDFMRDQYQSVSKSAFMKHEEFVWSVTINGVEIPLMFTVDGGCMAWLQLERSFPHLVVDSLADNHPFERNLNRTLLPPEHIRLEGNFPDYFHVYQELGQQIMTLQILAPDRMMYLVNDLRDINLEIQEKYLRLYAAHAQRSAKDFQSFMKTLDVFQTGLKVANLNKII